MHAYDDFCFGEAIRDAELRYQGREVWFFKEMDGAREALLDEST